MLQCGQQPPWLTSQRYGLPRFRHVFPRPWVRGAAALQQVIALGVAKTINGMAAVAALVLLLCVEVAGDDRLSYLRKSSLSSSMHMRALLSLFAILLLSNTGLAMAQSANADTTAVKTVLSSYKAALEKLDLTGVDALFAPDNQVVESGKVEGGYADYRDHHIGPELGHFKTFKFSDYAVAVRLEGPIALTTETYRYTIVLKDKPEPIERQSVTTSVLKKIDGQWKIVSTHSSSRTPKPKAKP